VSVKYLDCEDLRPKCTDTSRDYSYADMVVDSITDHQTVQEISQYTNQNLHENKRKTIILVNKVVDNNEYDHFFELYWRYTTFVTNISISHYTTEDKTVIIMQVK
jgi:predicted GTPase